nr:lactogen II [Mus musculus domesticus]
MKLSLSQPCSFSGALLLLAVSNLLVWEKVTSLPNYRLPTESLYQRVIVVSHNAHDLASKAFMEFEMKFGRTAWTYGLMLSPCHTAAILTPENSEQVHQTTVYPGAVASDYTFWSAWSDLQSSDESTKNSALRTLWRCVRRDTHKVDNYLKVLKCRDVHNNNC